MEILGVLPVLLTFFVLPILFAVSLLRLALPAHKLARPRAMGRWGIYLR